MISVKVEEVIEKLRIREEERARKEEKEERKSMRRKDYRKEITQDGK